MRRVKGRRRKGKPKCEDKYFLGCQRRCIYWYSRSRKPVLELKWWMHGPFFSALAFYPCLLLPNILKFCPYTCPWGLHKPILNYALDHKVSEEVEKFHIGLVS